MSAAPERPDLEGLAQAINDANLGPQCAQEMQEVIAYALHLETQRDVALRVVEAARAWREAVHDTTQPMVPRQLDLLAAVEEWEAGA